MSTIPNGRDRAVRGSKPERQRAADPQASDSAAPISTGGLLVFMLTPEMADRLPGRSVIEVMAELLQERALIRQQKSAPAGAFACHHGGLPRHQAPAGAAQ
jgi:hypothetical protein